MQSLKPAQLLELHAKVSAAAGRRPRLFESVQKVGSIEVDFKNRIRPGLAPSTGTRATKQILKLDNKHTPVTKSNRFLIGPWIPDVSFDRTGDAL